jgi:polysaccharide chain length determinant protein (PEP-CTERM system associated)
MLGRTLISRPTVEKLIVMSELDKASATKTDKNALIDRVTKSVQVRSTGRDNLYTLSFRDESPETSLRVVQSLLSIFLDSNQAGSRNDSDSARRFIEEQIKNYEKKLTDAETRLKDFRLRHLNAPAQGGLDMAGRMSEVTNTLSQARLELREAESARDSARRQLEEAKAVSRSMPVESTASLATPEVDARIEALRRSLDGLLQRFTDQHPDVLNTRRLIRELEDQKKREVSELRRAAQAAPVSQAVASNPAILELTRILSTSEVQVASLRARVAEYELRAGRAREQLKIAPQIEAELAQLNRDYDVHRKNYEELVARRETVVMSGELDTASGLTMFRVIDPPRVGSRPVAPNRVLLLPIALLFALGSGVGIAFLASQFRPAFFDSNTLREVTELPLLGVVSLMKNDAIRRKGSRSLMRFLGAVLLLVVLFLLGMVILSYRSGL